MTNKQPEHSLELYEFAEWILEDSERRGWYDEAKMHWIGDPDPEVRYDGRHPWVKRIRSAHGPEHVFSQPALAAFSITERSLMSVQKDPCHSDSNPDAWFVGIHNLATGETHEPILTEAKVSRYGQAWLRLAENGPRMPRDQKRIEMWLKPGHHSAEARYTNGLRELPVIYEDIVSLEAMMRVINQANGLLLPGHMSSRDSGRASYYARAA